MAACPACGKENPDGFQFCGFCAAPLTGESREQRKTVTVLFCDVTGSTELGESTDPEALRALLARYFVRMKAIVESHGGTVEKFIGDAVMAVFGIPVAHEDDALRACRAAVEMRDALPELGIRGRVGVNTGEVVTGTAERLATGDAVNVAARLEQAAEPGEVLIGEATHVLVEGAVVAEPVEPLALKGKSEPVGAFRIVRVGEAPERSHGEVFVGRERELEEIAAAWLRAGFAQRCELVTVLADAGVGKTRLAAEALGRLDVRVVRSRCLSYGEGITYWPVVEVVKQLAARPSDPAAAAVLASLLGESDAGTSAEEIAWAFRKLLEEQAPLICVFEDIHWGEETFLDLVEHLALLSAGAQVLLLCTARPELLERRPAWPATIRLAPLGADDVEQLVPAALPSTLREQIARVAGGNPLFVTEMVAMVEATEGEVTVPPTLRALLAARLDQIDAAERRVLERGAVEGEIFHRGAVQALAPDEPQVTARLAGLVRRELVRPDRAQVPGEDGFRFRHLLIRDAAYEALPKSTRADLHERFADWLELQGAELVELDEILAYHLEQAHRCLLELGLAGPSALELAERAAERLAASGRRAFARGDVRGAAGLLRRAAALLPLDDRLRLGLLPVVGRALFEAGEPAEAERVLAEAVERARAHGLRTVEVDANVMLANVRLHIAPDEHVGQGDVWSALDEAIPFYEKTGDEAGLARALGIAGNLRFWRGDTSAAIDDHRRAADHARNSGEWAQEVESLGTVCMSLLFGPTPVEAALARIEQLAPAGEGNHPLQVNILRTRAHLEAMRGNFQTARELVDKAETLGQELGLELTRVRVAMQAGPIEMLAGDPAAAERRLRPAYETLERMQHWGYLSSTIPLLVDALLAQGRDEEAAPLADVAQRLSVPEDIDAQVGWRRIRAKILARQGDIAQAERLAREATEIADTTEYLDLRAQTAADLAEVLRAAGQQEEAAKALANAIRFYEQKGNTTAAATLTKSSDQE